MRRSLLLFVLATSLSACASMRGSPATDDDATLRVDNRAFLDMNVYVVDGARRERLGTASGNRTTELRLPGRLIRSGSVQFLLDPIGSNRSPISDRIDVQAGDVVELTVPPS